MIPLSPFVFLTIALSDGVSISLCVFYVHNVLLAVSAIRAKDTKNVENSYKVENS